MQKEQLTIPQIDAKPAEIRGDPTFGTIVLPTTAYGNNDNHEDGSQFLVTHSTDKFYIETLNGGLRVSAGDVIEKKNGQYQYVKEQIWHDEYQTTITGSGAIQSWTFPTGWQLVDNEWHGFINGTQKGNVGINIWDYPGYIVGGTTPKTEIRWYENAGAFGVHYTATLKKIQ